MMGHRRRPEMRGRAGVKGEVVSRKSWSYAGLTAVGLLFYCHTAAAQRANENAVTTADDAFGTRVGNDDVGLYDSRNARGFDPQQAGNMRLEGMYFDQQATFGSRLQRTQSIRVGLTAQSYPFPAPTGIVDTSLIMPADRLIVSAVAQYSVPIGQRQVIVDVSTPVIKDKLGMFVGTNYQPTINDWIGKQLYVTTATLWRFTPSENFEAIPFIYYNQQMDSENQPQIFTAGAYRPPRYDRTVYFGQDWTTHRFNDLNAGLIMRGTLAKNWRVQGAIFRSEADRLDNFVVFYRNTQSDGMADLAVRSDPHHRSLSYSGELRATGVYTQGSYRHTVHFDVRGRDTVRLFGGGQTVALGRAAIGVVTPFALPVFAPFGVRDRDAVKQITPGVSYGGQWAGVGEFTVAVQKSVYDRKFGKEGAAPAPTSSRPWLYSATATATPSRDFAVYAGYTRGLEEFGTAPDNALNAGAPVPAALTRQVDGGIRWRFMPGMSVVAGLFDVKKPYFDRDTANIYTGVGSIRHRGIELSLSGKPLPGLTVIAGSVFLQARVSGLSVDRGLIGDTPPGTSPRLFRLSLQYGPSSWRGVSVDTLTEYTASPFANRTNTFRVPGVATMDAGVRYAFKLYDANANIRLQLRNVFNSYDWTVDGASGRFTANPPRRVSLRLAADF